MRLYHVAVNKQPFIQKASRAAVAVHRVMDRFSEPELDGATITVRQGELIKYAYRVIADVPCDPPGSHKRDFVSLEMSKTDVQRACKTIREARPELKNVWYVQVEVKKS
jgi:hypothetical protein